MKILKEHARKNSVHAMLVYTGGCNGCDIEVVNSLLSPYYDLEQYRVFITWNPREADILIVTGPITRRMLEPLKAIYDAVPEPKAVVACGSCPIKGCVYTNIHGELGPADHVVGPLDKILPVACKIPGCPPRPEDVIAGVVKILPLIMEAD
ncbi:NADH-quinone oxidoreductase subunit B family protein [Candidatus Altiarchaeota archaeon]